MSTRYRTGGVGFNVTGDLEATVRRALGAAAGASVSVLEDGAQAIVKVGEAKWYTLVKRKTGQSGDLEVVTTVDADQSKVRVGIGSTDSRMDGRRPVPAVVHTPGPTSVLEKRVDHKTYWSTPPIFRSRYPFIFVRNPKAGVPIYLLETLVKAPAREKLKELAPQLAEQFRRRVGGGRG